MTSDRWIPSNYPITENIRAIYLTLEKLIQSEETQVNGVVILADYKGVSLSKASHFGPFIARKVIGILQVWPWAPHAPAMGLCFPPQPCPLTTVLWRTTQSPLPTVREGDPRCFWPAEGITCPCLMVHKALLSLRFSPSGSTLRQARISFRFDRWGS